MFRRRRFGGPSSSSRAGRRCTSPPSGASRASPGRSTSSTRRFRAWKKNNHVVRLCKLWRERRFTGARSALSWRSCSCHSRIQATFRPKVFGTRVLHLIKLQLPFPGPFDSSASCFWGIATSPNLAQSVYFVFVFCLGLILHCFLCLTHLIYVQAEVLVVLFVCLVEDGEGTAGTLW